MNAEYRAAILVLGLFGANPRLSMARSDHPRRNPRAAVFAISIIILVSPLRFLILLTQGRQEYASINLVLL